MSVDVLAHLDRFGAVPPSFRDFLSLDGLGTTSTIIADYSSGADFCVIAPASTYIVVERLVLYVADATIASSAKFGDLTALSPGVTIAHYDEVGQIVHDLTAGEPLKTNADMSRHCYDAAPLNYGPGNDALPVRWTLSKSGCPTVLEPGHRLSAVVAESFVGLVAFTIKADGYQYYRSADGLLQVVP